MNGLVANPTLPPARRLIRGFLVVCCCVLSVALVGAGHTKPSMPLRPAPQEMGEATDADVVNSEDVGPGVVQAALQQPVEKELLQSAPVAPAAPPAPLPAVPAGRELLRALPPVLSTIMRPAPRPAPAASRVAVKWMEVTAYCACKKCCGPRAAGITASGRPVTFNDGKFVAADKNLSFHTKLVIPGYASGEAVPVLDRGGAIKGNKLDVYFPSHAEAKQWGRRFIPVTVLN